MKRLIEQARRAATDLERMLDSRMNRLVRAPARRDEPLEIRNAILAGIEERLVTGPLGAPLLPFDEFIVELRSDAAPAVEAMFEIDGGLAAAVRKRLAERDSRLPPGLSFDLRTVNPTLPGWPPEAPFRLRFRRRHAEAAADAHAAEAMFTLMLGGEGNPREHPFTGDRVDIGRVAEVRDQHGRLVRRNTLRIEAHDDPDGTVSRRHAHIKATVDTSGRIAHILRDDASRYGTRVIRNGEMITVHPGTAGVRLRDGDEIVFGSARARVRITAGSPPGRQ